METQKKEKNMRKWNTLVNRLLLVVVMLFLFNFNYDAFDAGAVTAVTGTGTPGYIAKWITPSGGPTAPSINAQSAGPYNSGANYVFNLLATDSANDQIRYGVDWLDSGGTPYTSASTMDGTADVWTPYGNSGQTQTVSLMWPTSGAKKFQALAQNFTYGTNSSWSSTFNISIQTNGSCGTADGHVYSTSDTVYAPFTQCSQGTSNNTAFPTQGTTVFWTCLGSGGGANSPQCSASMAAGTFALSIDGAGGAGTKPTGGSILSTSDANLINCGSISCSANYTSGSNVTLSPVPDSSYWKFTGWTGACTGSGSCVVNVTAPTSVGATFVPRPFNYIEF